MFYAAHPDIQELNTGRMLQILRNGNGFAAHDHPDLDPLMFPKKSSFSFRTIIIVPVSGLCKESSISIYFAIFSSRQAKPF